MRTELIVLLGVMLAISACQSSAYNDARARCEASAIESMEDADPQPDQRATYREQHIQECMEDQGFSG